MERFLPIPVHLLKSSIQSLREEGLDIPASQELLVTKVMDSGDVGGVMCQIEYDEKQNIRHYREFHYRTLLSLVVGIELRRAHV